MPATFAPPTAHRPRTPGKRAPRLRSPAAGSPQPFANLPEAKAAADRSCACGGGCPRCREQAGGVSPAAAQAAVRSAGEPLDAATRGVMEERFGHDFSAVRVHTGARAADSARRMSAAAYTVGSDIVFGEGRFEPGSSAGSRLLAHELAHVVQQSPAAGGTAAAGPQAGEAAADRVEESFARGGAMPALGRVAGPVLQRKVEMRDVGRGEQSGFARLPELIDRLNAMSSGVTYAMNGHELQYTRAGGGTPTGFDNQLMGFIDQDPVIPLRLTNRHGLLGDRVHGFHDRVLVDAWESAYVDIDDLLASDDLGLQSALVHFLRERSATRNYARRIGSPSLDLSQPGPAAEFDRAHNQGLEAETQLLRDFFGDQAIRRIPGAESGNVFRVYRDSHGARIRTRVRSRHGAEQGVDPVTIDVVTRDGQVHTAEEYRQILEDERIAQQKERERLAGATEHREGGRSVPAP